jgi:hypothetical protein
MATHYNTKNMLTKILFTATQSRFIDLTRQSTTPQEWGSAADWEIRPVTLKVSSLTKHLPQNTASSTSIKIGVKHHMHTQISEDTNRSVYISISLLWILTRLTRLLRDQKHGKVEGCKPDQDREWLSQSTCHTPSSFWSLFLLRKQST